MSTQQDVNPGGEEVKPWERAWDPDEMRKHAGDWSLAGDSGMLLYLQSFSQELLARTHSIQDQLNQVNREAKMTGVKLNNVFNDFIMLANTQFVENRVYDEDVTVAETQPNQQTDTQDETKEQREAELIPKINEALRLGLDVIESAFEKLDVNEANSSDDEEDVHRRNEVLLEPKDPYLHRPLPHLIGSVNFMHDENVGLIEESDEETPEDRADSVSESSSESEAESDIVQKPDKLTSRRANDWSPSETESESDDDLFDTKDEVETDEDVPFKDNKQDKMADREYDKIENQTEKPSNYMDELGSKLRGSTEQKPKVKRSISKEKSKPTEKRKSAQDVRRVGDDIFGDVRQQALENSLSDDEDGLFVAKSGRFTKGGGLFDDVENDESVSESDAESDRRSSSLQDTDNSSNGPVDITTAVTRVPAGATHRKHGIQVLPTPPVAGPKSRGLFDDDDDDLFSSFDGKQSRVPDENKTSEATNKPASSKPSSGLFADDDDDLFSSTPLARSTSKPTTTTKKKVLSLFDDEEDDETDDIFSRLPPGGVTKSTQQPKEQTKEKPKQGSKSQSKSHSMFDDEDDLFGTAEEEPSVNLFGANSPLSSPTKIPESLPLPKPHIDVEAKPRGSTAVHPGGSTKIAGITTKKKAPSKSLGLFDEDNDSDVGDIFSVTTKPSAKKPIPSRVEADSPTLPVSEADPSTSKRPLPTSKPAKTSKATTASLFDDVDDLFSGFSNKSSTLDSSSARAGNKPITKPPITTRPKNIEPPPKPEKIIDPLFGAGLSTESPVAATAPRNHHIPSMVRVVPPKDTVATVDDDDDDEDDEDLFTSSDDESDANTKKTSPVTSPPEVTPPAKFRPPGAVSMFGGVAPSAILGKKFPNLSTGGDTEDSDRVALKSEGMPNGVESSNTGGALPKTRMEHTNQNEPASVISFDQPAQGPSLQSATKSRAKLSGFRRPPSRRIRQPQEGTTKPTLTSERNVTDFFTNSTVPEDDIFSANKSKELPETDASEPGHSLQSTGNAAGTNLGSDEISDIFGGAGMAALPKNPKDSTLVKPKSAVFDGKNSRTDPVDFGSGSKNSKNLDTTGYDDIFGDNFDTVKPNTKHGLVTDIGKPRHVVAAVKQPTRQKNQADIPSAGADIKSEVVQSTKEDKKQASKVFDGDLFGDSIPSKPKSVKKSSQIDDIFDTHKPDKVDNIFGSDDEDIFGSSSNLKQKGAAPDEYDIFAETPKATKKTEKVPKVDDFDIFSSEEIPKATKKAEKGPKAHDVDIFGSEDVPKATQKTEKVLKADDFDIFGSGEGSSGKDNKKPKNVEKGQSGVKVKDKTDNLFEDNTDIFSDVPAAKPRPAKVKKENNNKPSIFSDSDDDLFAPSASSKPKPKVTSTKQRQTTKKTPIQDIFGDDSPSIFDDPLLATKK